MGYAVFQPFTDCDFVRGIHCRVIVMFPALKQNLGSHSFKDNHEVETVVAPWPITQDVD